MKLEHNNIINFNYYKKNENYKYYNNIYTELEKKYNLTDSEKRELLHARSYCYGFTDGTLEVIKDLKHKKLETQILTLENLEKTLLTDITNKIERLKIELMGTINENTKK